MSDYSSKREYIFGPMSLEDWYVHQERLHEGLSDFSQDNPNLDINTILLTTDLPDLYYIKVTISEF